MNLEVKFFCIVHHALKWTTHWDGRGRNRIFYLDTEFRGRVVSS